MDVDSKDTQQVDDSCKIENKQNDNTENTESECTGSAAQSGCNETGEKPEIHNNDKSDCTGDGDIETVALRGQHDTKPGDNTRKNPETEARLADDQRELNDTKLDTQTISKTKDSIHNNSGEGMADGNISIENATEETEAAENVAVGKELVVKQMKEDESGKSKIIELITKLRALYQTDQYSHMSCVRWGEHAPVYPIQDCYVDMNCEHQTHHPFATKAHGKKKKIIPLTQIFEADNVSSPPTRHNVLIEGQPGSGKTSFCKKLAYDWSRGAEEVQGLLSNFCVFFVKLSLLRADQSLTDYITTELLNDSSSKDIVETVLTGIECLVILDGYDELRGVNNQLIELIIGSRFPCARVIVTSRQGALRQLRYKIRLLYTIQNLTDEQVVHVSQHYKSRDGPLFTKEIIASHSLRSYIINPLYLSWICIFFEKLSDTQINNISDFYGVIVNAICERAVQQLEQPLQQCMEAFDELCEIAYRAMCDDNIELDASVYNLTRMQQNMGFTNTYYKQKGENGVQFHCFIHKTLLEYLAARHTAKTTIFTPEGRSAEIVEVWNTPSYPHTVPEELSELVDFSCFPVVDKLTKIADVATIRRCVLSQINQFVLGLLAADNRGSDMLAVISALVLTSVTPHEQGHHRVCSHYGLLCYAQCKSCPDLILTDSKVAGKVVSLREFCRGTDCLEGILMCLNRGGAGVQTLSSDSKFITKENVRTLTKVPELEVIVTTDRELVRMYGDSGVMLGVGKLRGLGIWRDDDSSSNHPPPDNYQLQSAITNLMRHEWACPYVNICRHPIASLLAAWRECSAEERGRVRWGRLMLPGCFGTEEEKREMKALFPRRIEIVRNEYECKLRAEEAKKAASTASAKLLRLLSEVQQSQTNASQHDSTRLAREALGALLSGFEK